MIIRSSLLDSSFSPGSLDPVVIPLEAGDLRLGLRVLGGNGGMVPMPVVVPAWRAGGLIERGERGGG